MSRSVPTKVPEGGWGWVVCLASSWTNGVVFGIINSFGVLYTAMVTLPGATAFKTSWIGSVCAGLTFFMSPFASIITDKFGCRPTAVFGGVLALAGVLASSCVKRIEYMYITYGFAMGLGFAIAYQPSLFILGVYFKRRLGLANGLVCFGSAVFTIVLPIAMEEILTRFGLGPCLWFQSSIVFIMIVGGLTFKQRPEVVQRVDLKEDYTSVEAQDQEQEQEQEHEEESEGSGEIQVQEGRGCCGSRRPRCSCSCGQLIDLSIWKERNYRIWAIGVPIGMFGYFVPFFHLVQHVNDTIPHARAEVLIMCLGATSGVGRLVSGYLSDHPKVNPIRIQQLAFLVIGVCTTLMPVIDNFMGLCALVLVMGIFDGAFVAMVGIIAFNLVGPTRASQAIGVVLGLMAIPMMIGPPVAGMIYDLMGTYDIAFICSGVPPILASCILFLIRTQSRREDDDEKDTDEADNEKEKSLMIPRDITSGVEAKESEANAMNSEFGDGKKKKKNKKGKNKNGGNEGEEDGVAYNVRRGRRRSYMRYRMPLLDTRVKMVTEKTPDVIDHRPNANGVVSNGGLHYHAGGDNRHKLGVDLTDDYGNDGNRSPYAQRNRNQSNHKDAKSNGAIQNGHIKLEVNGYLHRSFSQESEVALKLNIKEKETTV